MGKREAPHVKRAGKYGHSSSSVILLWYGRRLKKGGKMGGIRQLICNCVRVHFKRRDISVRCILVLPSFLGTCWISGEPWLASRTFR